MNSSFTRGCGLFAAILAGTIALAIPCAAAPQNNKNKPVASTPTTYSGRAMALDIEGVDEPVSGSIILADTGPLPASGGSLAASESNYVLYGTDGVTVALGFEFAQATVVGAGRATDADSTLTDFVVRFQSHHGEHAGAIVTITADEISASATASISANGKATATASSSFTNLRIDGTPITVTGEANQTVEFTDGRIVFNEQTTVIVNGRAEVRLIPMHVYMCECMEGFFGVVEAGITVGTTPPPAEHDCGKLTGGGWIMTPSGAKGTFAVSGGIRRGEFWGQLNYNDHGAGLKVKSTRVTGFAVSPDDADCRIITYDVEINGLAGMATVVACDHGEPGRDDEFSIRLSTGYAAGGSLGGDRPGGGNIQVHKCPPGWDK